MITKWSSWDVPHHIDRLMIYLYGPFLCLSAWTVTPISPTIKQMTKTQNKQDHRNIYTQYYWGPNRPGHLKKHNTVRGSLLMKRHPISLETQKLIHTSNINSISESNHYRFLLIIILDRPPCPDGMIIVWWWCSTPYKKAKETLDSGT